jgi:hypothetical protein
MELSAVRHAAGLAPPPSFPPMGLVSRPLRSRPS